MKTKVVSMENYQKKHFKKAYEKACVAYYGTTYVTKVKKHQA